MGSQILQFMQQYTEHLAGHLEALQKLIDQMHHMALMSNKSLEQYIQKFRESADPDFVPQGDFMEGILSRWEQLHHLFDHLTKDPTWLRLYYFLKDLQLDIAHSTLTTYQAGFNLTLEGFCYASVGMVFGWAFYQMAFRCLASLYSGMRAIVYSTKK